MCQSLKHAKQGSKDTNMKVCISGQAQAAKDSKTVPRAAALLCQSEELRRQQ